MPTAELWPEADDGILWLGGMCGFPRLGFCPAFDEQAPSHVQVGAFPLVDFMKCRDRVQGLEILWISTDEEITRRILAKLQGSRERPEGFLACRRFVNQGEHQVTDVIDFKVARQP